MSTLYDSDFVLRSEITGNREVSDLRLSLLLPNAAVGQIFSTLVAMSVKSMSSLLQFDWFDLELLPEQWDINSTKQSEVWGLTIRKYSGVRSDLDSPFWEPGVVRAISNHQHRVRHWLGSLYATASVLEVLGIEPEITEEDLTEYLNGSQMVAMIDASKTTPEDFWLKLERLSLMSSCGSRVVDQVDITDEAQRSIKDIIDHCDWLMRNNYLK